jgi:DNA-binding response OmpR family regulator
LTYVLVAEDDPYIQLLVRRKLESAGMEVRAYMTGEEALKALLDGGPIPMVMLLDIMLPGRDGLDICRELKQKLGKDAPPVIILSARGQEEDVIAAREAGADDYLIKPFAPQDLLEHVKAKMRR